MAHGDPVIAGLHTNALRPFLRNFGKQSQSFGIIQTLKIDVPQQIFNLIDESVIRTGFDHARSERLCIGDPPVLQVNLHQVDGGFVDKFALRILRHIGGSLLHRAIPVLHVHHHRKRIVTGIFSQRMLRRVCNHLLIKRIGGNISFQPDIALGNPQRNIHVIGRRLLNLFKPGLPIVIFHLFGAVSLVIGASSSSNPGNKRFCQKKLHLRHLFLIANDELILHQHHPIEIERVFVIPRLILLIGGFEQRNIQPAALLCQLTAQRNKLGELLKIVLFGVARGQHHGRLTANFAFFGRFQNLQQGSRCLLPFLLVKQRARKKLANRQPLLRVQRFIAQQALGIFFYGRPVPAHRMGFGNQQ